MVTFQVKMSEKSGQFLDKVTVKCCTSSSSLDSIVHGMALEFKTESKYLLLLFTLTRAFGILTFFGV